MPRDTILATLASAAILAACSDSTTNPPPPDCTVSTVAVTGAPAELHLGSTAQLTADVTSSNCSTAPTVAWSTTSAAIVNVSGTGMVTANSIGNATITATAGGKSGTVNIEVVDVPVDEVRILPGRLVLGSGAAQRLVAQAFDASDNPLPDLTAEWTTSDPAVATVDGAGNVTALTAGASAVITATIAGISANIDIHVVRRRIGYFWNHSASAAGVIEPDEEYSFNSLGGTNLRNRIGTGNYHADFGADMAREGWEIEALFVSTYVPPAAAAYCLQSSWTTQSLHLFCRDVTGEPFDTRWTALHVSNGSFQGKWGFAWFDNGTTSTSARMDYSYTPNQGSIVSERLGTGRYQVTFEGLGRNGAAGAEGVFVNSYSTSSTCQPGAWTAGGDDLIIEVWCFKANGSPADEAYTVLLLDQPRLGAGLAYVLADQPSADSYTPTRAAVRPTGSVQINRQSPGVYSVGFTGFNRSNGLKETFLVTAVGTDPGRCAVGAGGWTYGSTAGSTTTVRVNCWTTNGAPADMRFSVLAIQ